MGVLPNKSQTVSEEEDNNYGTMEESGEGDDESVCKDGEDEPPDDLR